MKKLEHISSTQINKNNTCKYKTQSKKESEFISVQNSVINGNCIISQHNQLFFFQSILCSGSQVF